MAKTKKVVEILKKKDKETKQLTEILEKKLDNATKELKEIKTSDIFPSKSNSKNSKNGK